jgi:hypothetical protein
MAVVMAMLPDAFPHAIHQAPGVPPALTLTPSIQILTIAFIFVMIQEEMTGRKMRKVLCYGLMKSGK